MTRLALICALLALISLTAVGCGRPSADPAPEILAPVDAEAAPEGPALPEGATVEAAEGSEVRYTLDQLLTVDGGRELTLRLHCRAVASGYGTWTYGVGAMDVLDGNTLLQTLSVGDAIWTAEAAEGITDGGGDGWTSCFDGLYLPELGDLNFDGAHDIRLMEFLGTVNGRYLHWLWDSEAGQFVYAFCLVGFDFQIDCAAKQLVTEARDGYDSYYTDYYQYDEAGALQHVKEIHAGCEEEVPIHEVHELVDGKWVQTQ